MKGFVVALVWSFILLGILSITHPMWAFAINSIVTSAGGDQLTALTVQIVFVVLALGVVAAIWIFRGEKENMYYW
jgi:hypothetical protein